MAKPDPQHERTSGGSRERQQPRLIESAALLGGSREVHIRHEGQVYRLRVTRSGKLILHK